MKSKIIYYLKEFVAFFILFMAAEYISEGLLKTDKWYVELPIFLVFYMVFSLWKAFAKNKKEAANASKPFDSVDEIAEDVLAEIRALKASGDKVKAVKKVREVADADLLEAKQFVDKL